MVAAAGGAPAVSTRTFCLGDVGAATAVAVGVAAWVAGSCLRPKSDQRERDCDGLACAPFPLAPFAPSLALAASGTRMARTSAGALAMLISTVGAAQSIVAFSSRMVVKMARGSTLRRQRCVPPTAVTIQVNVHPLAWNIGSVHR